MSETTSTPPETETDRETDSDRETAADREARRREQRARLDACKRRVPAGASNRALAIIRLFYRDRGGIEASLHETPHGCDDCELGKWADEPTLKVTSPQWGALCPPCHLSRMDNFERGGRNSRLDSNAERFADRQQANRERWAARHRKRVRELRREARDGRDWLAKKAERDAKGER